MYNKTKSSEKCTIRLENLEFPTQELYENFAWLSWSSAYHFKIFFCFILFCFNLGTKHVLRLFSIQGNKILKKNHLRAFIQSWLPNLWTFTLFEWDLSKFQVSDLQPFFWEIQANIRCLSLWDLANMTLEFFSIYWESSSSNIQGLLKESYWHLQSLHILSTNFLSKMKKEKCFLNFVFFYRNDIFHIHFL